MNTSYLVSLLLAVAVVILSLKILFFSNNNTLSDNSNIQTDITPSQIDTSSIVLNNIFTRTSIRDYTQTPVSEEKIETMLRAAMAAPTARNLQPWHFIVVDNRSTLDSFAEIARGMNMAPKAPLAILICGKVDYNIKMEEGRDFWAQDASAATENLLLAAHSLGLGAVWCGVYPVSERVEKIAKIMNLPTDIIPLNVIFIGNPAENPAPKNKWKPEKIHRNHW